MDDFAVFPSLRAMGVVYLIYTYKRKAIFNMQKHYLAKRIMNMTMVTLKFTRTSPFAFVGLPILSASHSLSHQHQLQITRLIFFQICDESMNETVKHTSSYLLKGDRATEEGSLSNHGRERTIHYIYFFTGTEF